MGSARGKTVLGESQTLLSSWDGLRGFSPTSSSGACGTTCIPRSFKHPSLLANQSRVSKESALDAILDSTSAGAANTAVDRVCIEIWQETVQTVLRTTNLLLFSRSAASRSSVKRS